MSQMSSQRRKLNIDPKPKSDRLYVKGDYLKWLKGAQAQLASYFKPERMWRHPSLRRILERVQ